MFTQTQMDAALLATAWLAVVVVGAIIDRGMS